MAPAYAKRRDRLEVSGRIDSRGDVVEPLDEERAREVIEDFNQRGIDTIAISFVNAYLNGELLERTTEQFRAVLKRRSASSWD